MNIKWLDHQLRVLSLNHVNRNLFFLNAPSRIGVYNMESLHQNLGGLCPRNKKQLCGHVCITQGQGPDFLRYSKGFMIYKSLSGSNVELLDEMS